MLSNTLPAPPEIDSFTLRLDLGCTVMAGENDWLKPAVSGSIRWRGIPTEEQLTLAARYIHHEVLEPTLREALIQISQRLEESRKEHLKSS